MQLANFAKTPALNKIVIDDENIVKKYKEPLEFYILDRIDVDEYLNLMDAMGEENIEINYNKMLDFAKKLMLDEKGKPILSGKKVLPADLTFAALNKMTASLGNF